MKVVNNGRVIVEIESVFEQWLSKKLNLIYVGAKDLLNEKKQVASSIPKRVYGTVIAAPPSYVGPAYPITYQMDDIPNHPVYEQLGMQNLVTVREQRGTHGECYYANTIQDHLLPGDKVWFRYNATEDPSLIEDRKYAMPAHQIVAYERDGDFRTFGGRVFLEPIYPASGSLIATPDSAKPIATSGRVAHIGLPLRGGWRTDLLEVGDEVVFPAARRWEIEVDGKDYVVLDGEQITKIIKRNGSNTGS